MTISRIRLEVKSIASGMALMVPAALASSLGDRGPGSPLTPGKRTYYTRPFDEFEPIERPRSRPCEQNPPMSGDERKFPHIPLREIWEQPQALRQTISRSTGGGRILGGELLPVEEALRGCRRLIIAASGSSRHAGLAGEIMIEDLSGVAVDVEYASEYCYRSTHAAVDPIVM